MFKNAFVYRIDQWESPTIDYIESRLAGARFTECGATQPESIGFVEPRSEKHGALACLIYTSDADDEEDSVDLGGRRIIKK